MCCSGARWADRRGAQGQAGPAPDVRGSGTAPHSWRHVGAGPRGDAGKTHGAHGRGAQGPGLPEPAGPRHRLPWMAAWGSARWVLRRLFFLQGKLKIISSKLFLNYFIKIISSKLFQNYFIKIISKLFHQNYFPSHRLPWMAAWGSARWVLRRYFFAREAQNYFKIISSKLFHQNYFKIISSKLFPSSSTSLNGGTRFCTVGVEALFFLQRKVKIIFNFNYFIFIIFF